MEHELKIGENYLQHLLSGEKRAEVRVNDRDYQKGDTLVFNEYKLDEVVEHRFLITHIHSGMGMLGHYVVLSLVKKP